MVKKNNHTLFYAIGPDKNIYKSIGYTNTQELILAVKYIVDVTGDRQRNGTRYTALNFPFQSFQLIKDNLDNLKFSYKYNCFLPTFSREDLEVLDPRKELQRRYGENNPHMKSVRRLLGYFSKKLNLNIDNFGLDASLLCDLEKEGSDIDLLIYGKNIALKCFKASEQLKNKGEDYIKNPLDVKELYLYRRQPYSLFMNDEEILLWESRKISFMCDDIKVSILPIDHLDGEDCQYISTGQFIAISSFINKDQIIFEPGNIELDKSNVIYGPKVDIKAAHTIIPVRTGVFLKKGDKIFASGILYRKIVNSREEYVLAQFPWDYCNFYKKTNVAFVIKIDLSNMTDGIYKGMLRIIDLSA